MRGSDYPPITPQELAAAGQALYGAAWRCELSRILGVDENDIVLVEAGTVLAPADWRARLVVLAQDRALRAMEMAADLMWSGVATETSEMAETHAPRPGIRLA
jgi:hypothetical protein